MPEPTIIENEKPVTEMSMEELEAVIAGEPAPAPDNAPKPQPNATAAPAPQADNAPTAPPDQAGAPAQSEIELLKKQLADSQSFIGRLGNELGQLRKQLSERDAPKADPVTPDQVLTDPVGATKRIVQETISEAKQREQAQIEQVQQQRIATAQFLSQAVPNIIELLPDMAEVAKSDGVPAELIERFKTDPLSENPFITVQLAKRAEALRELKKLRAEQEELRAQPKRVLDSVNQAARARPAVSAAHGRTEPPSGDSQFDRAQIARMSDAELLKLMGKN